MQTLVGWCALWQTHRVPGCPAITGTLSSIRTKVPNTFNLQCLQIEAKVVTVFCGKLWGTNSVSTTQVSSVEHKSKTDWLTTAVDTAEGWNETWWHSVSKPAYSFCATHSWSFMLWHTPVGRQILEAYKDPAWGSWPPDTLDTCVRSPADWACHECSPPAQERVATDAQMGIWSVKHLTFVHERWAKGQMGWFLLSSSSRFTTVSLCDAGCPGFEALTVRIAVQTLPLAPSEGYIASTHLSVNEDIQDGFRSLLSS